MADNSHVTQSQEYDTLRHELLDAKRYIFERPLAITAVAAVGLQVLDKPNRVALAIAISFLTLFNLWFTVGRLQSAARIAAYIALVLEPSRSLVWDGWETSLRKYRRWLRDLDDSAAAFVDEQLKRDPTAASDALMYYPAIYIFHIALMVFAVSISVVHFRFENDMWTRALGFIPICLGTWSVYYFWRSRPRRLRFSIERNRVIWGAALESLPHCGKQTHK